MSADNGSDNKGENRKTSEVVLTFDHATFALKVTGDIANFDTLIAMCDIARRWAEDQLRAAKMSQVLTAPGTLPFGIGRRQ